MSTEAAEFSFLSEEMTCASKLNEWPSIICENGLLWYPLEIYRFTRNFLIPATFLSPYIPLRD